MANRKEFHNININKHIGKQYFKNYQNHLKTNNKHNNNSKIEIRTHLINMISYFIMYYIFMGFCVEENNIFNWNLFPLIVFIICYSLTFCSELRKIIRLRNQKKK